MCGLFGVFPCGTISRSKKNQLRQLVLWLGAVNDDRGGHSYGVWGRDTRTVKGLGYFIHNMRSLQKMVKDWRVEPGGWIAGHTRFATHGAKTVANAHPFEYGNLTLAHNGVVSVYGKLDGKEPEVDSNHLAKYLSQQLTKNPENTFEEVFKHCMTDVIGSVGLLMSDELGNLRAYASNQELHIAEASWGYAISSSKSHLVTSLEAAGLTYNSIWQVPEDNLVAPWYAGMEDFFAPSWGYSSYAGYGTREATKTWKDYQREAESGTSKASTTTMVDGGFPGHDTLDSFNSFYRAGDDKARAAAEGAGVFAGFPDGTEPIEILDGGMPLRPGDWEGFEDWQEGIDPVASSLCELCSDRAVGVEPAAWTDPDSGRVYLICDDCKEMFEAVHDITIDPIAEADALNHLDTSFA